MTKPLHGLVLVGGQSKRMGRDKALLSYDGQQTQLQRTAGLLGKLCDKVFASLREDQTFPLPLDVSPIFDEDIPIKGPLRGILSAINANPEADWFVVACDLPRLDVATLAKLVDRYHSEQRPQLTAYRSNGDGLPEPLCAIYPSGIANELLELSGKLKTSSPRKLLIAKGAILIDLSNPDTLDNVNTADGYEAATKQQ